MCVCVWPEPALLRGIEVPIPALLTASLSSAGTALLRGTEVPIPALLTTSLSSAGPALLRALAVPRDLTGNIQSDRHYSTGTTEGPVLCIHIGMCDRRI